MDRGELEEQFKRDDGGGRLLSVAVAPGDVIHIGIPGRAYMWVTEGHLDLLFSTALAHGKWECV